MGKYVDNSTPTLARVRENVYCIKHPATNAAITRMGGHASPKLLGRLFNAVGTDSTINASIEFKRGRKTKRWYFEVTPAP